MIVTTLITAVAFQGIGAARSSPGSLVCFPPGQAKPTLCALKNTRVDAYVEGFSARVVLVQTFKNTSETPVEAVYTFPLPEDSAVDRMRIQVGARVIEGELKKREDARRTYEAAKAAGQVASLLDQERANVFTQSIANLTPGAEVKVEISYAQMLKYENGQFEFFYPMTIGPRFMGAATPDPEKISPSFAAQGTRTGADIDLRVHLKAGAPIQSLNSVLHKVKIDAKGEDAAEIVLSKAKEIPNRDFILRYGVATDAVQSSFLAHYEPERGGFFSLAVMPPKAPKESQISPKELIFVMDQSGSQSGFPIDKSKELTLKLIEKMRPGDTFNVLGFSNDVTPLWPSPRPNTAENREEASAFVKQMSANGGTQLQKAVVAALAAPTDARRLRYVVFNTDGFVGQDKQIIDEVRRYRGTSRMFTFGIGNSVNRDLVESMAIEGRGDSEIVTLAETADRAVDRFLKRSGNPIVANVTAECSDGMELTPEVLPDVLSDKPIVVFGRYSQPGRGVIELKGTVAGKPWSQKLTVELPVRTASDTAMMSLWARRKVDDIMRTARYGEFVMTEGSAAAASDPQVRATKVALEFGIMSPFTSFVAVEKRIVNVGGKMRTVNVPLDAPDGVDMNMATSNRSQLSSARGAAGPGGGGFGGGGFGGGSGGFGGAPGAPATAAKREFKEGEAMDKAGSMAKLSASLQTRTTGIVSVQIRLTNLKAETLEKLAKLGFKLEAQIGDLSVVIGKINAAKLAELVKLDEVKSVEEDK